MFESFSRSWEITKLSVAVIKADRELLAFPILSGVFSILFMLSLVFPALFTGLLTGDTAQGEVLYVILFLIYLGLSFIATFFNVCVVYTTKKRFEGGNATLRESLNFAFSKLSLIFAWSMVSATVGLILRFIDNITERGGRAMKVIGDIVSSLLGLVWSIVTIFVVPAMVYHDLGPLDAIKRSMETINKTWGESIVRHYGLGFAQFLCILPGLLVIVLLVMAGPVLGAFFLIASLIVVGLYLLGVFLFFTVANSIFNTALYVYADTGRIPGGYSQGVLAGAFTPKHSTGYGGVSGGFAG